MRLLLGLDVAQVFFDRIDRDIKSSRNLFARQIAALEKPDLSFTGR